MRRISTLLSIAYSLCLLTSCGGGSSGAGSSGGNSGGGGGSPSPATHFSVVAPQKATTGTAFNFTVTALDASNNTITTYSGTVHFSSTDSQALLPANSGLTNGTGMFPATLETGGSQTITAADTVTASIMGVSGAIQVSTGVVAGSFTPTGSMEVARQDHTATLLSDGKVLITGGENVTGVLATEESYDPASGAFTSTGSMGTARAGHTATLLSNEKVLVVGGDDASGNSLATAEIYDPVNGTFTPTGSMKNARVGHTATLLNDGRVLVAGGGTATAGVIGGGTATAELFDPNAGQFAPAAGDMIAARSFHTATLLASGEVLLAGGTDNTGANALGDLFNPTTGAFTATATGGTTALHLAASLLRDGRVLLTGGDDSGGPFCTITGPTLTSLANAILFDNTGATFSETGDMTASRESHTATTLSGGEVLIAGGALIFSECRGGMGHSTFTSQASAEPFDPTSGTFAATASMTAARSGHTATLLVSGKVLVVGGVDENGNVLASAELFQ